MKRRTLHVASFAAALALWTTGAGSAKAQSAAAGAEIYQRCAACHLPTGQGVPGAFPPLDAHIGRLAGSPDGRAYLAMALTVGLNGPITVEGKPYAGVMPPQGLSEAEAAAVLNHVLRTFAKAPASAAFSSAEVAAIRKARGGVDSARLARLRPPAAAGRR